MELLCAQCTNWQVYARASCMAGAERGGRRERSAQRVDKRERSSVSLLPLALRALCESQIPPLPPLSAPAKQAIFTIFTLTLVSLL